ncbi:hypothetical protein LBBP_03360 [Leptospira borgpetersenii serovar Ballum]|uniref:Uncharacterized protein n=1 Tax=Leptospira borgpetersenii serovar Ballum TaxID=280505 RepID=A0A0S2IV81_LEPBO|nr:hypothetical protein LBBP_03360 [Leptospira borgpetersenii serovar Ballum]
MSEDRLKILTKFPVLSNRSARVLPINPVPPAIPIFIIDHLFIFV